MARFAPAVLIATLLLTSGCEPQPLPEQEANFKALIQNYFSQENKDAELRRSNLRSDQIPDHPQLSLGMFCSTAIPAEPLADALLVPRSAVHENNQVYVFEPDPQSADGRTGRLVARRVPLLRSVGDRVLVDFAGRQEDGRLHIEQAAAECELRRGELTILSPLPRAVVGMKLRLREPATEAAGLRAVDDLLARAAYPTLESHLVALFDDSFTLGRCSILCSVTTGTR